MRRARKRAISFDQLSVRITGVAIAAFATASPAAATDRQWKVPSSGAYGTGSNWTGNVVPGPGDQAIFGQTGSTAPFTVNLFTQVFTVGNLSITNQVPQFVLADGAACCATLNVNGTLAVRAGTQTQPISFLQGIMQAGTFTVGASSVGAARLEDAALTCTTFSVGSGSPGSSGSLEVTAGSTLVKNSCCDGEVGRGISNVGTMVVDSSDVLFNWKLFVGRGGGNGTLELRNGALLDLTASNDFFIGWAENAPTHGSVAILSGSTLNAQTLLMADGPLASADMVIDAATLNLANLFRIGAWQSQATVTVTNGGQLVTNDIVVGENGGHGTLVVEGPGSYARGLAAVGINSSLQPVGMLKILDGAHVSSLEYNGTKRFVFLGIGPGASGTAIASGQGTLWDNIDWLTVGGVYHTDTNASGTLTILDGARVECQRGIIAERPSDDGTVTVGGAGSTWAISGELVVGNAPPEDGGNGDLIIEDGGQVTCAGLGIGSSGSLSITLGPDSSVAAIAVNGNAALGGSLSVTLADGFQPAPGVPIPLITANGLNGGFASVSLPANAILEQVGGQLRVIFAENYVDLELTPAALQAAVGYATQATATAIGESGSTLNVSGLAAWSSSNPAIASVDSDGTVVGVAAGSATISASYDGFVAYADVTVSRLTSPSAFELLSITASGVQSNAAVPVGFPAMTPDGQQVLLWTASEVLTGPTPGDVDLIVKDRTTGAIELVNRNAAGEALTIVSVGYATMSDDGRYVAFASADPASIPGAPGGYQVYLRDRLAGTLELISVGNDGSMPNGSSGPGWVSGDARYVAFQSSATNLVSGIRGLAGSQVYLRDRVKGTTTILSAADGVASDGLLDLSISISPDGSYVTFESNASNLVPGDTNGASDVFLVTTATGAIERVSLTETGGEAQGGDSFAADISDDGQRILFLSEATNLVRGHNGFRQVYLRDRAAGTTVLATRTETGGFSTGGCGSIALSGDGRFASFRTAGPLVAADTNSLDDVYRFDVDDSSILLVSASSVTGSAAGQSSYTGISEDGGLVVFQSPSAELAPFDQNGLSDWFAWGEAAPVIGDLDGDNVVNAVDLGLFLGAWGTADPAADLNGDGVVDAMDLAMLLGGWTG